MITIPDAPWIREAENHGPGYDGPEPQCPICHCECERIYHMSGGSDVLGCENCIEWDDAFSWMIRHEEG